MMKRYRCDAETAEVSSNMFLVLVHSHYPIKVAVNQLHHTMMVHLPAQYMRVMRHIQLNSHLSSSLHAGTAAPSYAA
jgi:hypothetical protein